jgi:type II secretory pathway component GspD/PulD (secretin)
MITPQSVRQFLANAGVDLAPPKSAFFNDRTGTLLVHATMDELDIIEQAVGTLSTTAGTSTKASRSGTPSNPVPPATNGTKVPVLGDLPVVGPLFQIRTAQVSAANSPQPITNAAHAGTADRLLTRIMKVNPDTFRESIRTIVPLPDSASPQETMDAFRKLVLSSGVELRPPANMFYSERAGSLFVRAIAPEMEVIEQMVHQLNIAPAQVNIRAKFVEVSDDDTNLIAVNSATNGPVVAILTDPQFRVVLRALEGRDGADLISESAVTTLSGRQAQVQNVDAQTIVKLNPQALVPPGVASSNVYVTERLLSGPLLDIIPYVSEGGDKIQLTVSAKVTEFVGYDAPESGEAVPVYLDGQATIIKPPHPRTHVRSMQLTAVNLTDGQTVVLGRPKDEMITYDPEGKALSVPSTTKKNLLVFVTATLIDPTGNPVHTSATPSATPDHN